MNYIRLYPYSAQLAALKAQIAAIDSVVDATFTASEKTKLAGIAAGAQANAVSSVAGKAGAVTLVKADVGLSNVDNTSDANKPVSTATAAALAGKATTAQGAKADTALQSGASLDAISESATSKKFSATERTKLAGVAAGATANDTDANLKNRGNHTGAQPISSVTGLQAAIDGKATVAQGAKADTAVQPADLTKTAVGLANVDNTSDAAKPISTATAAALAGKATAAQGAKADTAVQPAGLTKAAVGLANVDDTSDAAKPISTATAAALAGKATAAQGAKADTAVQPAGLTKAAVGLGSVDNTSDASKPISTATAAALAGKATSAQGAKADAAAPQTALNAVDARLGTAEGKIEPITALVPQANSRPGSARPLFSTALTGDPLNRAPFTAGTIVNRDDLGPVLRIAGSDVPAGPGYIDVARRIAFPFEEGRTYFVYATAARFVDPSDPEGHAVELRLQNLNGNLNNVSNVRLGPVHNPTVAGGPISRAQTGVLIGKAGAPGTLAYTIPPTSVAGTPHLRIYGNGHSTDAADVSIVDVTDFILAGLDRAAGDQANAAAITAESQARIAALEAVVTDLAAKLPRDGSAGMLNNLRLGNNSLVELFQIVLGNLAVGEDGYLEFFTAMTPLGEQLQALALSIITGETRVGRFDQDTLDRASQRLFANQSGMDVGKPTVGEDRRLRILDLRNADGDQLETYYVDTADGRHGFPPCDEPTYEHIAEGVAPYLPPSGGVVIGDAIAAAQPIDYFAIWNQSDDTGEGAAPAGQQAIMPPLVWPRYGMMLNGPGGLRGPMDDVINRNLITDFVPAYDERYARDDLVLGQVPAFGMLTMADRLNIQSGTPRYTVARACGRGGLRIDQMMRGSVYYTNALADFQKAQDIAVNRYGRLLRLFVFLGQGVADRQAGTTKEVYKTRVLTLLAQIREDFTGLHPDAPTIRITLDQIAPRTDVTQSWEIAQAQYELMRDYPNDVILSQASYQSTMSDNVHLDPIWRRIRGEYRARANFYANIIGSGFKPTRVDETGTPPLRVLDKVTFKILPGRAGPIARDITAGSAPTDGFGWSTANVTASTITDAAQGLIELTLDAPVAGDLIVGENFVGRGPTLPGAWTNIRDSDVTPSALYPDKLLRNWLVQCRIPVA